MFAIQQCLAAGDAAETSTVALRQSEKVAAYWKHVVSSMNENHGLIQTIALSFGGVAFGIRSIFQALDLLFKTRTEIYRLIYDVQTERQSRISEQSMRTMELKLVEDRYKSELKAMDAELKAMDYRRAAEIKAMEYGRSADLKAVEDKHAAELKAMGEKHAAELKLMEDKLVAERVSRASEVALARSEAVKEFLILGGTGNYAHALKRVLDDREKQNESPLTPRNGVHEI